MEDEKSKIVKVIPTSDFYFQRGVKAFQKNNMEHAKRYLSLAVSLCKNEEEKLFALCQLAICCQHTGDFSESITILDNLIAENGDIFAEAYYFQANNYAFLEEFDKALENLDQYLINDPAGDFVDEAVELKETIESELNDF